MALKQSFKVRDFRNKSFFMVDDAYLNGYAKILGTTTSMVYFAICRSADKEQIAFPSQQYIAEKLGLHRKTINRHIKKLQDYNIIKIEKVRNHKGRFLHNTYFLLDKSEWKRPMGHQSPMDVHGTPESLSMGHQSPTKETHKRETHTLSIANRKKSSIKSITEEDCKQIAEKYQVPLSFVMSKLDDLENYCEMTGRRYKNYVAALRNFVKQDAIKLRKEQLSGASKRAIDASGL